METPENRPLTILKGFSTVSEESFETRDSKKKVDKKE
jgi:hypothetical protein